MSIFDILSLFGGLALFLYGMRLMGDGLKESSSGTLKTAMESVTNNPIKAFLLGLIITAIIQSSTATIVITSGLVAAGIVSLRQSLGVIVGANVGTTVTGQIIRLLDVESQASGILQFFRPSTLAPLALIIGIVIIMGLDFRNSRSIGNIAMGFGILFTGLMNMTGAVNTLSSGGFFNTMLDQLGSNPVLGYLAGAGTAFVLQSSSATIGILQAFSASGQLAFNEVYAVIVGVYLGDCVTTAIVCSIGAQPDAKRVGMINILYNLGKSVMVLLGVFIFKQIGLLDGIWNDTVNPGYIANTNSLFNLVCAVLLFPFLSVFESLSYKIITDKREEMDRSDELIEALNPAFIATPALALKSCYDVLKTMCDTAEDNISASFKLVRKYEPELFTQISKDEDKLDHLTDALTNYLAQLSGHLKDPAHVAIMNHYYKVVSEFERLGDYAMNIAETAQDNRDQEISFSDEAQRELDIIEDLIMHILERTDRAFRYRDVHAAEDIEPLEEVIDALTAEMMQRHMDRVFEGKCTVYAGKNYSDILMYIERISDTCSNIGLATITRVHPELAGHTHDYTQALHSREDERFNKLYDQAYAEYFRKLNEPAESQASPVV